MEHLGHRGGMAFGDIWWVVGLKPLLAERGTAFW
jgi:hypothetical protein